MQFDIKTVENGVLHVTLGGRLDLDATLKLENPFAFRIATQAAPVVVDLTSVEFVASMWLRLLIKNARAVANRGGRLVLCSPAPVVREALTMAGLHQIVPIFDTFDAAAKGALNPAGT